MVHKGRVRGIPFHSRLCPLCKCLDDETHAVFHCHVYDTVRLRGGRVPQSVMQLRRGLIDPGSNPPKCAPRVTESSQVQKTPRRALWWYLAGPCPQGLAR